MTGRPPSRLALLLLVGYALSIRVAHSQANPSPTAPSEKKEQAGVESAARQHRLQAEADRLVTLAEALKKTMDHTRKDELSVTLIRQAEEIERAARKMQ